MHEGFNGDWERPGTDDNETCWQLEMPLMVEGKRVGHLKVVGQPRVRAAEQELAPLLELVETCEVYLQSVDIRAI